MNKNFYVYIMTNKNNSVIYVGVTNNLKVRVLQHKNGAGSAFTRKYKIIKLVYYEIFDDAYTAISREKQIKAGSRQKKMDLINKINKNWQDLYPNL